MWYVAQVQAGRESSTLEMCRRLVPPSVMEDCFMPEYEVMWKIRGEWRLVKRLLFPGYLFFVTDDPRLSIGSCRACHAHSSAGQRGELVLPAHW